MRLFIVLSFVFFLCLEGVSQSIVFSPIQKEEDVQMDFKILGKLDSNFLVYKNIRWKHILTIYDRQMRVVKSERIKFVPDRTFNMDFVVYPGYFYIFYQYEKNNIIYCYGVKMNANGDRLAEPVLLDTTRISVVSGNKIYATVVSEDKQRILIYKTHLKNERLTLLTKLFNKELALLDSNRMVTAFEDRTDYYGDLMLGNDGTIVYAKNTRKTRSENFSGLQIYSRHPGDSTYAVEEVNLADKYIDEVFLRPDNSNNAWVINSFYYDRNKGNIMGLFSAIWSSNKPLRVAFNVFEDSVRSKISASGRARDVFDNLFVRSTLVRRSGGFILTAESYYSKSNTNDNTWNRSGYLSNYPYYSTADYWSPYPYYSYYDYYRPYRSYGTLQSTRYYYDDIIVLSLDSALKCKWQNLFSKRQFDDDNENFLSYCTMNMGGELTFFYIEDNRKNESLTCKGILPGGEVRSYGTIKSREPDYEFMPRLARQVGAREMIVPCAYRSNIIFARLDFTK